ncbi:MAG TPA: GIY-YIG nuclease family protein [Anaerolineales bacterium]|jgi:putative endonuclease
MRGQWFVYIITNYTNSVLYAGITNDLARRVGEHKTGFFPKSFCKRYRLYKLIWCQEFDSPQEALAIEKRIKGWRREKKIALIEEMNPGFQDLTTLR